MSWPKSAFGFFHKALQKHPNTFWPTQYTDPLLFGFPFHSGRHRALSRVHSAPTQAHRDNERKKMSKGWPTNPALGWQVKKGYGEWTSKPRRSPCGKGLESHPRCWKGKFSKRNEVGIFQQTEFE